MFLLGTSQKLKSMIRKKAAVDKMYQCNSYFTMLIGGLLGIQELGKKLPSILLRKSNI